MRVRAGSVAIVLVAALSACAGDAGTVLPAASTTTSGPPRPLVWAAMGDSYSAGIGGPGPTVSDGDCQQDRPDSYAAAALAELARTLPDQRFEQRFVACGGATTADVNARQLAAASGADVASLTIGGNDLGFFAVVARCVQVGCASYDRPGDDLPGIPTERGRTDWQVLTDRLTATFVAIRGAMAPDGWLYALSYPIPAPEKLDAACPSGPAPLRARDIVLADALALRLGDAVHDAVDRANATLEPSRAGDVVFVDWRQAAGSPDRTSRTVDGVSHDVAFNPDGVCTPDPMINGIVSSDLGDSFHPTARGARLGGGALAAAIAARVG